MPHWMTENGVSFSPQSGRTSTGVDRPLKRLTVAFAMKSTFRAVSSGRNSPLVKDEACYLLSQGHQS